MVSVQFLPALAYCKDIGICTHVCTHRHIHPPRLTVDRRNTPATSSQSAFHHSVTVCQLQSPSLQHATLIFNTLSSGLGEMLQCQKDDIGVTFSCICSHSHTSMVTQILHIDRSTLTERIHSVFHSTRCMHTHTNTAYHFR